MIVTAEIAAGQLAEPVKHVQAGNEVLLTQSSKPVAKLVSATKTAISPATPLLVRSLKGHRALAPAISQAELAEEIFGPQ
jgi:prevent-host-death family protein